MSSYVTHKYSSILELGLIDVQMNQQGKINMSGEIEKQFLLTSKIGNGNFSIVYLAKHKLTQSIFAIKTMNNHIPIAIKQAQLLKKINHPNVIKLHKFQKPKNQNQALMVLEYVPQNILQLYQAHQYGLKEQQVKCILFQACLGLHHIHKKGIIHRDIKPQNIMINRNKAEVKLIDFGLAIEQDKCITDYVATRWYRAPQNLLGTKQYTVAIDIFSLGCVIVQLIMGNPLFPGSNNIDQISKILTIIGQPTSHTWKKGYEMFIKLGLNFKIKNQKKYRNLKNLLTSCSEGLVKLIQRMLILNPYKRITAQEILKDPYFHDVEKIIPPNVYDQYLIDLKPNSSNLVKQERKIDRKVQINQRIRFLSEEKGFGAFSSFKSTVPLGKINSPLSKQKQKYFNTVNQIQHDKKVERNFKYSSQHSKSFIKIDSISQQNKLTDNKSHKKIQQFTNPNYLSPLENLSPTVKNSLQNYEKNLLKLSASLQNIKNLKSSFNSKDEKKTLENFPSGEIYKSSQQLSFRGFNQQKQRFPITKEGVSSFLKKKQSSSHFPIKSKKVIEYLQKFQNAVNKKEDQKQVMENSRSQPSIYQSLNSNITSPKKPSFLSSSHDIKSYLKRQSDLEGEKQRNRFFERISDQQNRDHLDSFHQNQLSKTTMAHHLNVNQPYLMNKKVSFGSDTKYRVTNIHYSINSPSIERSLKAQQMKNFQSPTKKTNSFPVIKFNQSNSQHFVTQKNENQGQNIITSSSQFYRSKIQPSFIISPTKKNQLYQAEPISKALNSSPIYNSVGFSNTQSMNISSNRPIHNKIKMIAVRDNISNNDLKDFRNKQTYLSGSFQTSALKRNPSFLKSFSHSHMQQGDFSVTQSHRLDHKNLIESSSIRSPKKEFRYFQDSPNYYKNQQFNNQSNYLGQNQTKQKYFRSLQQPQFTIRKSPDVYPLNISHQQMRFKDHNSAFKERQSTYESQKQPKIYQKSSFAALSQLRQSITGLTKTINQGVINSSRSDMYNNKNININLNLNIYEPKIHRKK